MYEEKQEGISVKAIILQVLIVILFVFLLMWLFPLRNGSNNASNNEGISIITDRVFSENIDFMKEAAKSYFTNDRLPKNIGDKVTITLGEMLQKKVILGFVDKDGKVCDNTTSYVEITKLDNEYEMKINLKCSNQEDYLIVKLGCYDYCDTDVCENEAEETKWQYKCTTKGGWSSWSSWSKTVATQTSTKQVETKTAQEKITTQENQSHQVATTTREKYYVTKKVWKQIDGAPPAGATSCTSDLVPVCDGDSCTELKLVYTCLVPVRTAAYRDKTTYTTVTETVNVEKLVNVTYYRYRTYKKSSYYFRWSTSKTDSTLIKKGCKLTGKTETYTISASK